MAREILVAGRALESGRADAAGEPRRGVVSSSYASIAELASLDAGADFRRQARRTRSRTRRYTARSDSRGRQQRARAARFLAALRARRPAIIAEIKRASPSKGDILPGLDPAAVARDYARCGAAAISVLTDRHFKGSLEDLRAVRAAVDLPLLRKDFIFDPYQLYQARAAGADCILLIAAMLKEADLRALYAAARELGLQALVEVHNEDELRAAARAGAEIDRDQQSRPAYVRDRHRGYRAAAAKAIAATALIVSESGIDTPEDIRRLDARRRPRFSGRREPAARRRAAPQARSTLLARSARGEGR